MIKGKKKDTFGIVLAITNYSESSAIITFASLEGLLSLLVKNVYKVKSNLKPALIVGNYLKIEYADYLNNLQVLTSLKVIFDNSLSILDFKINAFYLFFQELTLDLYRIGNSYPIDKVIKLLSNIEEKRDLLTLTLLLIGIYYDDLGLDIDVDGCVNCSSKQVVTYSLKEGGFLCKNCMEKMNLHLKSKNELYILKFVFMDKGEESYKKIVPVNEGIMVLKDLVCNLQDYFDLRPFKTFDYFLKAILN